MTDTTEIAAAEPTSGGSVDLSTLRLPQLQAVASQLGISGTGRMRKSELLEAIQVRQQGGTPATSSPPARTSPTPVRTSRRAAAPAGAPTRSRAAATAAQAPVEASAPVATNGAVAGTEDAVTGSRRPTGTTSTGTTPTGTTSTGTASTGTASTGTASTGTASTATATTDVAPTGSVTAAPPTASGDSNGTGVSSAPANGTAEAPPTIEREPRQRSRNRGENRDRDTTTRDTTARDTPTRDTTARGTTTRETPIRDAPRENSRDDGPRENGARDSATRDASVRENGTRDNGARDSATRDASVRDNGVRDTNRENPRDGNREPQARDAQITQNRNGLATTTQNRTQNLAANTAQQDDDDDTDGRGRRRRGRYRDRKRRPGVREGGVEQVGGTDEPELSDDDVVVPVAGILDVLDSYAFVRTSGYLPGPNDIYVSLGQVKKYGLRKGDAVAGAVRQPRDGEQQNQRQKFNALVRLDSVNGAAPEEAKDRPEFGKLIPLYPQERLRLETEAGGISNRIIDLVAPIGKGQRGLIVSPPKAGKTLILQSIASAITRNNPECHLMVVLVDERPEEVTDMQRTVKGEVIASTFDRPADDHTTVAELAIERAKRLVELGHDVVVLLDSITRLGRAYNIAAPASGRILSGGVDSSALYPPKRFFGAARNIEDGGSLTILATALIETGSKMDEVIFEEFKGTGNMELRLSRNLADKRIFPAVDVNASGTRREEILMGKEELNIIWKLRRVMGALEAQQAIELLLDRVKKSSSNAEFLMAVSKSTPVPD